MLGVSRSTLLGTTPSDTEYCPASIFEATCATSPPLAGSVSAEEKTRMATFGSFISFRARVLLPFGRLRTLCGRWTSWGFSNPVLQRRPRIQPSKNVRLNVVPQAHESGVVSAVVSQTGNSRVRILAGNTARDQVGPNREGRQIASPPLFVLEDRELRRLRSGVEHRGGSHKLLFVDASQRISRRPQQHKLSPNRRDDLPAISLAGDAEVSDRAKGLGGEPLRCGRVIHQLDRCSRLDVELRHTILLLGLLRAERQGQAEA